MKFGRPLAIIVHYPVQFNLECCKNSVSDRGPNTMIASLLIIINNFQNVRPTAFATVHNELDHAVNYHSK